MYVCISYYRFVSQDTASVRPEPHWLCVPCWFVGVWARLMKLLHDLQCALELFETPWSLQQARVKLERLSRRCPSVLVNAFLHLHLEVPRSRRYPRDIDIHTKAQFQLSWVTSVWSQRHQL